MLDWFGHRQQPIHILLTKCDKLTRNQQAQALAQAKKVVAVKASRWGGQVTVSLFSATAKIGRDEIIQKIGQWWGILDEAGQPIPLTP
jgi:GTP-binding protein